MEWGERRKERFAVLAEEKVSSRPMLTLDRLKEIKERLSDVRLNLKVIQRLGHVGLYGEGLIEYSRLLGQLEPYALDKKRHFND